MTAIPSDGPSNSDTWEGKAPRQAKAQVTDPVLVALLDAIVSGALRPSEAVALILDHIKNSRPYCADDATAIRAIALSDAAHGAEGIAVIDPYARELARWVAEGRMSGDEAVAFVTALIDASANLGDPDSQPDPSEYPQSEPGSREAPITAAPINPGNAQAPSDSQATTLSDRIGPFYDTGGLRRWFQISSEAVEAQVRSGQLLAVVTADGFRLFPAFQIDEGGQPLPRLSEVLAELDPEEDDPWGDAVWLNAPSDDLEGLTPAAALRTERADDVIRLARQAGAFRFG